jgi:hypothetical protein
MAFAQLRFGEKPVLDVMPVFTAVYHHNPPPFRLVRSRRTADEHAPHALLKKARFNEVLQQCSAHLPVEACHLRGASGGEPCAGVHEQIPDTRERFFDTSRLEWLRHVRCSSQLQAI